MSANLNQTNIEIDDPNFQDVFTNLQGNILKGHGRDHSRHVFFRFIGNSDENCRWVEKFASKITSTLGQEQQTRQYKAGGRHQVFVNLMLSCSGYQALGIKQKYWPQDLAFRSGMKDLQVRYDTVPRGDHQPKSNPLNDDVQQWESAFRSDIDGMILLAYAGDSPSETDQLLADKVTELKNELAGIAEITLVQVGHVMRNDKAQVIEHFGFVDGVSNPKFFFSDLNEEFKNGGYSRNDASASLNTVLVKDPGGDGNSYGTYVTYRKLQQNIKGFWKKLDLLANTLSELGQQKVDAEYAGALCVGRFKDGTPISEQGNDGWSNLFNNFNYDDDVDGLRCPFHAHTRKTNPRGDTVRQFNSPPTIEQSRRIVRRGISFGEKNLAPDSEWTEAGLLFISLQASIVDQFIFMQHTWCNNEGFIRKKTGIDPLVGQLANGETPQPQSWPGKWGNGASKVDFEFSGFVRNLGGEYLFMPSIHFLRHLSTLD
ncbi:Dyp-type peroxidase [Thalassomonas actiniarum]|uniref:Dyp-type peroxidase n=1 Tax=Thalassomonas actiniarum TaxID=485447 RepID=A0AAE9YK61_9GAMM|nr:Dyp-type peroxidase [Thalassomonas actiniarum]WDD97175.1 Dyp-type peroxidase [Thalassomonas actiniarum]